MSPTRIPGPAGALAVDDGGSGAPAVVLVHSLTGSIAHWQAQLPALRRSRRVVALDLRGHGGSDLPADGSYGIEAMADDIGAVVDRLGLESFALVGHSMGGGVALAYAGKHPDRVERLFLLDAIGDGTCLPGSEVEPFLSALGSPAYAETIEAYWSSISGPDPEVRTRLLADLRATPRQTVIGVLRAVARFDPKPALAAYQGAALAVVTPANDAAFSLHRLGRGLPHRVIEGTGHWIQLERPDEVGRMIEEFLREAPEFDRKNRSVELRPRR